MFALAGSELGLSTFIINLILVTSTAILLGLPMFFIFRQGEGKSAF